MPPMVVASGPWVVHELRQWQRNSPGTTSRDEVLSAGGTPVMLHAREGHRIAIAGEPPPRAAAHWTEECVCGVV